MSPLSLRNFSYTLPHDRIAQSPAEPRDTSRLLVVDRATNQLAHHHFYDLPSLLHPGDVLIRNNTKVVPARIFGTKDTGGHVEVLLAHRLHLDTVNGQAHEVWECMTKPGLKVGQTVTFPGCELTAECIAIDDFVRQVRFNQVHTDLFTSLEKIGHTPLPPYIAWERYDEAELRRRYQTMYAKIAGSAAAPTAGLHFTPEVDAQLRAKGVQIEEVTLHVGLGTFLRVKTETITDHKMHSEWFELKPEVAERLNKAKQAGQRLIAVGTTTTRVLETCAEAGTGLLKAQSGETSIFIYPPYQFKFVQSLITNFHESESTLLMLVSALVSAPQTSQAFITFAESVMGKAYQTAIDEQYRFHSFGDAMWIV